MKYFKYSLITIVISLLGSFHASAQSKEYKLRGTLIDSIRNELIEFATVAIIPKGQTNALKYALSDAKGKFEISAPQGEYILKVEYMGYNPIEKQISVTNQRITDIGNLNMLEKVNILESAVVTALGNPIVVKKDTIEYNVSSFKTTDTDMLEDLLKKLPGIELDADGKITAHGKTVDKIMIDGKSYFLNDPTIATKNLPSNIVDKVRVVNRKSDQARFTGIDDGNEETVIDLSIKPGMMNGWFGNATLGYGSENRYQAAGMLSNFKQSSMLSLVVNGNNTNNRAFTDMMGGMMAGMGGGMRGGGFTGGGGGGRVRVGGAIFNFGGSGITTSWMAGLNGHKELFDGKLKIGGNYNYGTSSRESEGSRLRQNFLPDSSFFNNDGSKSKSISANHTIGLEMEWAPSETTSFIFRPNITLGEGSSRDSSSFQTYGAAGMNNSAINEGGSKSTSDNSSLSIGGNLLYRQRLGKPGRTFSVNLDYSYSNTETNGLNESATTMYSKRDTVTEIIRQNYLQTSNSYSVGARASYTEPLGKNFFMELAYRYSFRYNDSDKEAFNYNNATGEFDIRDEEYSNLFENKFVNQQADINLRKNEEKYSYTLGFNVQPSLTESKSSSGVRDINRTIVNYSPMASYEYRINETSNIRVRYNGRTNQPSINQLQPVPDNSNPLYVQLGNPDLLPEFNNSLSVEFGKSQRETFSFFRLWFDGSYTMNKIVNKIIYDEGGRQTSQPVNENGAWNISNNVTYNTPIRKSNFSVSTSTRTALNRNVGYTAGERNITTNLSLSENLRLTYRDDKLEVGLNGNARYSYAWYSIKTNIQPATWTNSISSNINWTLPYDIILGSDYNYMFYIGYGEGYNKPSHILNAELSK